MRNHIQGSLHCIILKEQMGLNSKSDAKPQKKILSKGKAILLLSWKITVILAIIFEAYKIHTYMYTAEI